MANFLDRFKVNTALEDHTKLDLSCDHITTANFMQFNVAYTKELVPDEKINIKMETFTRLLPMPVPTFGRARVNNRGFFVPYRTIFPAWNDFITRSSHTTGEGDVVIPMIPRINNDSILGLLISNTNTAINYTLWSATPSGQDDNYNYAPEYPRALAVYGLESEFDASEFDYIISDDTQIAEDRIAVKLTAKGRQWVKILESLGYKIYPFVNSGLQYSALPLLAIAKVYCDWYYPSAYIQDELYSYVESLFKKDSNAGVYLGEEALENICDFISVVNYDSDYFVSAWDNPNNPNDNPSNGVSVVFTDPSTNQRIIAGSDAPTALLHDNSANTGRLTQWSLNALRSLTDYMKRHQLVGSRALDRYLARFGVTLSSEKLNRSVYIGSDSSDIQFGDIMSTADTAGSQLGNYAGKGIGYGSTGFDFDTDEYGMLIIVSSILPKAGYYQGINRNVLHISPADFWTPEFDNLGTQAISKAELYVPQQVGTEWLADNIEPQKYYNEVFGWTPRYAEYKIGYDMLTGDYRCNSINKLEDSWYTLRTLNYEKQVDIVHTSDFVRGFDADQYSRIFYANDAKSADKFRVIHHFDIASYSPMKSLFDTYEFEDKGKEVSVDANGVKMN